MIDYSNAPKDQNVVVVLMQLVQEKYGEEVDAKFLEEEVDRLYNEFGNNLVNYFEPLLSEEHKVKFNEMIKQNTDQATLLDFLVNSIPNLETQILQVLAAFRDNYLGSNNQ